MVNSFTITNKFGKTGVNHITSSKNRKIDWIIIHYAAGITSKSGSAINLVNGYLKNQLDGSADFVVDDSTIVQFNGDIENSYTWGVANRLSMIRQTTSLGGKYCGIAHNGNSIQIEVCSNKTDRNPNNAMDLDWYFTVSEINLTAQLVKYLMNKYHLSSDHVLMHHQVTGKVCPSPWCVNESKLTGWYAFLNQVKAIPIPTLISNDPVATPPAPAQTIDKGNNTANRDKYLILPFTIVTLEELSLRDKPEGVKLKVLPRGNYTIVERDGDWGEVKGQNGWIYLANSDYCRIGKSLSYKVKINVKLLNEREKPDTNSAVLQVLKYKETFTIDQETSDGWGHIVNGGWIKLEYTKKI